MPVCVCVLRAPSKSTTTEIDGERERATAVIFLGIRMLLEQRRLFAHRHTDPHTKRTRKRERGRITHTATAHACARCENRRFSTAPSCCSPPRSSSLRTSFSLLFSLCRPLSITRSLPSSRFFPSLSSSRVGLPHGQRIRKRGYTRWINFIGALSLHQPSHPADDYIGIVPCFALLCSTPFCTPCIAPRWRRVLDKCSRRKGPPPRGNAIPPT